MSESRGTTKPAAAGIFSAADIKRRMAEREAQKAAEEIRRMQEQEAKQKEVMTEFHAPPTRTPDQLLQLLMQLVNQAAERGQTEVQVYRFPNALCTDKGRAINQQEPGWENTLTGTPKEIYQFWDKYFRSRGYKLRVQVVDFPGGLPGDIAMTVSWS